ncbi:hypothetical protein [Granulicella aggregans]|uniref:hypothetical protein n=1 Tax=Granulicella aggregans TaxID=474949 RepID=UPI0021E054D2|nr:hypothetical protein [Granulicella aggregans]
MHILTSWKQWSIVITGAFGILALLTDFKTKKRHPVTGEEASRINIWGYVSLTGIILTVTGGVISQQRDAATETEKTYRLAQKADETLNDIQRSLAPIDNPRFTMSLRISCASKAFYEGCEKRGRLPGSIFGIKGVSLNGLPQDSSASVDVSIYQSPSSPALAALLSGGDYSTSRGDLEFEIRASSRERDNSRWQFWFWDSGIDQINIYSASGRLEHTSGQLISILDLHGAVIVVGLDNEIMTEASPLVFQLVNKNGQSVRTSHFQKIAVPNKSYEDFFQATVQ